MTHTAPATDAGGHLRRLDRIDVWSLPRLFVVVIGIGTAFTYYDIFDINVSFIQTCLDIVAGCAPETAVHWLGTPVLANLVGYAVGAVVLSRLADRFGRRDMLMFTMLLTGLGSLYNALAGDYTHFVLARAITGLGVGADIAIVNVYISEVAPRAARARFTTLVLVLSAIGAAGATWLGLVLTTPAAPWPQGLPFAAASADNPGAWRWMYAVGALLALVALLLRLKLPESPRWLLARGKLARADAVIVDMERRARSRGWTPPREPTPAPAPSVPEPAGRGSLLDLFTSRRYLGRCLLITAIWVLAYTTVYGFGAGLTSILSAVRYTPSEAGMIVAIGTFGYLAAEVVGYFVVEALERKHWLPVGTAIVIVGAVLVGASGGSMPVAFLGSVLIFFGYNLWFAPTYALTAESFPTRMRAGAFGITDGIGHVGGGIGVFLIAQNVERLHAPAALAIICGFLVAAAALAQLTVRTRNRRLEDVSP
ncbi:MFS transporter [Pseudonocardia acaciae]|uniref:MFS transporter n=1 Tax=Pseudonocardia acaciae TaxID=551276 RepID=UPI00048CE5A8|nr:MFS transporter [Pseudonocardia acaciae]